MAIEGWRYYRGAAVPTAAPHEAINTVPLHDGSLWDKKALLGGNIQFIRYITDFDKSEESSFWYVNKDSFGGMEELSSKMRNQVKKSLKQLEIRMITKEEMLAQGYEVHASAASSYKVKAKVPSRVSFENYVNNLPENYDVWGAIIPETGKLIAWGVNRVYDDWCSYSSLKAIPEYQKQYYPYYGLIYEMNRYYLEERKLKYVTDGARSITEHSNIQPFLIDKFKFRKVYCTLHVIYRWWLKPIVYGLYPFRKIIKHPKVMALLNLEAMTRGEM